MAQLVFLENDGKQICLQKLQKIKVEKSFLLFTKQGCVLPAYLPTKLTNLRSKQS
jgi:hypothetical protein